jgi:hypothetical protein
MLFLKIIFCFYEQLRINNTDTINSILDSTNVHDGAIMKIVVYTHLSIHCRFSNRGPRDPQRFFGSNP